MRLDTAFEYPFWIHKLHTKKADFAMYTATSKPMVIATTWLGVGYPRNLSMVGNFCKYSGFVRAPIAGTMSPRLTVSSADPTSIKIKMPTSLRLSSA